MIKKSNTQTDFFCQVMEIRKYSNLRPAYSHDNDSFFVYESGVPVAPPDIRKNLRSTLNRLGLDHTLYDTHSFRIGRATDLFNRGIPVESIKKIARWKSNAVYKYLR